MSQTPSKLERRARALLRAYPAEYRHGRAEEIIGTLLEAAPPGRSFPTAREAWSLIAGGRHARAARNRRPGAKANLRLTLLLGISTYLGFNFGLVLAGNARAFFEGGNGSWLAIAGAALGLAVTLAPWLGSRAVTAALAIPVVALNAYGDLSEPHGSAVTVEVAELLIVLAVLAALSRGPVRLPRSWLWLPCATLLAPAAGRLASFQRIPVIGVPETDVLLLLAVAVLCWLVTDARPAFALCLAVLLDVALAILPVIFIGPSLMGTASLEFLLTQFAFVLPILLPTAWLLLRRQKTPSPRPFPEP